MIYELEIKFVSSNRLIVYSKSFIVIGLERTESWDTLKMKEWKKFKEEK